MEIHGFSPGTWYSRDFDMRIPCKNRNCSFNQWGKECVAPSAICMNEQGRCELYLKDIETRPIEEKK